jgi:hypothetical protein
MSLVTVIPVLVALATALLGGVLYVFQKGIDRRNALIELRRKTYQDFTDSLFETVLRGTEESLSQFNKCSARLIIVGSDDVAAKVGNWKKYMARTSPGGPETRDMKESKRLMAEFVIAMRRDCFEKSNLRVDQVYEMLPIED